MVLFAHAQMNHVDMQLEFPDNKLGKKMTRSVKACECDMKLKCSVMRRPFDEES